jgi:predicted Abi (CAAX) family protease
MTGNGNDFTRQRGLTRADFHDRVAGFGIDRTNDTTDPVFIMQKVLAEAFTSAVAF